MSAPVSLQESFALCFFSQGFMLEMFSGRKSGGGDRRAQGCGNDLPAAFFDWKRWRLRLPGRRAWTGSRITLHGAWNRPGYAGPAAPTLPQRGVCRKKRDTEQNPQRSRILFFSPRKRITNKRYNLEISRESRDPQNNARKGMHTRQALNPYLPSWSIPPTANPTIRGSGVC
jgi:hypothetical protein